MPIHTTLDKGDGEGERYMLHLPKIYFHFCISSRSRFRMPSPSPSRFEGLVGVKIDGEYAYSLGTLSFYFISLSSRVSGIKMNHKNNDST
jgi:hypothetical protein